MASYAKLLKKAGLPAPSGLASIPERVRHTRQKTIGTEAAQIEFMVDLFKRVCAAGQVPGANLQASIVGALNELKRLKSEAQ